MGDWKKEVIPTIIGTYYCREDQKYTLECDLADLARLLGYECHDFLRPAGLMDLVEEETREHYSRQLAEQLSAGDEVEQVLPMRDQAGHVRWLLSRGRRVMGSDGAPHLAGVWVDITYSKNRYDVEKEHTRCWEEQAKRDSLTKLYNTQTTRQLADSYLSQAAQDARCALLLIDLDDFKQINDQYGHMFGDVILVEVAQAIQKLFRARDVVGRVGGEEFLILMKDVTDKEIVEMRCRQLKDAFHEIQQERLEGDPLSCSIGVVFVHAQEQTYFDMFCNADQALYLAKDLGKDRYIFYDPDQVAERKGKYTKHFADFR